MRPFILIALNAVVIGFFVWLSRKKNLLSSFSEGKWWLTWFSIAITTLMDELTSIFYVPAESYAIVGVSAFVSPRLVTHEKLGPNHYLFPLQGQGLVSVIHTLIRNLRYDFPDKNITFHLGWPTSSWIDRLSIGIMVRSLLRLPKTFPEYNFVIENARNEIKTEKKS